MLMQASRPMGVSFNGGSQVSLMQTYSNLRALHPSKSGSERLISSEHRINLLDSET